MTTFCNVDTRYEYVMLVVTGEAVIYECNSGNRYNYILHLHIYCFASIKNRTARLVSVRCTELYCVNAIVVGTSETIQQMLCNPHLVRIICYLDSVSQKEATTAVDAAMHEPIFTEFADECLRIVENQQSNK